MALFKFKKKKKGDAPEGEAAEGEGGEAAAEKEEEKESGGEGESKEGGEGEGGEGGEGAPKKKSKKKLLIIIVAAVVLIGGGAGGAFMMGLFGGGEAVEEVKSEGGPVFYELPQILVNLNSGSKQVSFIKTTITLELADQKDVPIVQANLPRLVDSYNTFLREMRATDLYGSAGAYRLREEMLARANKILAPVKVKDVLFKELLVQ